MCIFTGIQCDEALYVCGAVRTLVKARLAKHGETTLAPGPPPYETVKLEVTFTSAASCVQSERESRPGWFFFASFGDLEGTLIDRISPAVEEIAEEIRSVVRGPDEAGKHKVELKRQCRTFRCGSWTLQGTGHAAAWRMHERQKSMLEQTAVRTNHPMTSVLRYDREKVWFQS